jgi:hypothetical protein
MSGPSARAADAVSVATKTPAITLYSLLMPLDYAARESQRLLSSWKDEDPGMRMVAEVIASAFASGFSWGGDAAGKHAYCALPDLKGRRIMSAFEGS